MDPLQRLFIRYKEMSKEELLIELGLLTYNLYYIKTIAIRFLLQYGIKLIIRELRKRL
jgi:hypothetical protein